MPYTHNIGTAAQIDFDPTAYEAARRILAADLDRARTQVSAELRKRALVAAATAVVLTIASIVIVTTSANLLIAIEAAWTAAVIGGVFWMWPAVTGKANLSELYGQYGAQLDELERNKVPLAHPATIEEAVAAIDAASANYNARNAS